MAPLTGLTESAATALTSIASLQQWKESHEDRCKERFDANARDLAEIKNTLHDINEEMKHTVKNLHALSEAFSTQIIRVDGAARDNNADTNRRIDHQKIWVLSSLVAALTSAVAGLLSQWPFGRH